MMEARVRLPGCKRLELFVSGGTCWSDPALLATQIRLLRALLPSVKELPLLTWDNAYQASFCEVKAPYLRVFRCECKNSQTVPCDVFEAAPALATIDIWSHDQTLLDGVALRAISAALRRGALQNLQELHMQNCIVDDGNLRDLMDALERSGCAARLATLRFAACMVGGEGMRALADLLCENAFPALKKLRVPRNPGIKDVGVVALADALGKATQTSLTHLDLACVNMGDEDIAALASLVSEGHLEQLKVLYLCDNHDVSDQGIITLAQAIGTDKLEDFRMERLEPGKVTV